MKHILVCISLFFLTIAADAQWLKTSGHHIVNEKGEKIILRGMGLGGWMLQEGYMFRLSFLGQQYRIKEKIEGVVGKDKAALFYEKWLTQHTTKQDIDSLAAWGFNSIRLPMHYNLFTLAVEEEPVKGEQTWLQKGFALTDSLLKWCKANRIYLILDLHAAPGGQGNDLPISDRNPSRPSLWESEANQEKTIALWKKLAERYAHEPWIGGYDIINEPNWGFEDPVKDQRGTAEQKNIPLRKLMVEITQAIRAVDQKHMIIIEGNGFGNNYRGVLPAWDTNMVISFHKYGNFNTASSIKGFLDLREQYNIPLWLGESGENSNTWFTEAIELAEKNGIGWAWWQHKKMGINNPLEIKRPDGYEDLIAYWSGKKEKPTTESAWTTLQQLLENVQIKNNHYHPDVVDAMIRQVQHKTVKPFRKHIVGKGQTIIQAVDFDMGRQRIAYYDTDSARYQYTPGVNTEGNRGHVYRNDGVDIQKTPEGYAVYNIADTEWMHYTIEVKESGNYQLSFIITAEKEGSKIEVTINGETISAISVPATGGIEKWKSTKPEIVALKKGNNTIKVTAFTGGFNLLEIRLATIK
jgi:endoglucanase